MFIVCDSFFWKQTLRAAELRLWWCANNAYHKYSASQQGGSWRPGQSHLLEMSRQATRCCLSRGGHCPVFVPWASLPSFLCARTMRMLGCLLAVSWNQFRCINFTRGRRGTTYEKECIWTTWVPHGVWQLKGKVWAKFPWISPHPGFHCWLSLWLVQGVNRHALCKQLCWKKRLPPNPRPPTCSFTASVAKCSLCLVGSAEGSWAGR